MFIDKTSYAALNLSEFDKLLEPVSALGRNLFKQQKHYIIGDEASLAEAYQIIEKLMKISKDGNDFFDIAKSALIHLESIKQIVFRAEKIETFELFEIFEIKTFIYFCSIVRDLLEKYKLSAIHNIPAFTELFTYLDKDGQQTPSFHLSKLYSTEYAKLLDKIDSLKIKYDSQKAIIYEKAKKELKVDKLEERVVVSRFNKSLNNKLAMSECFSLESENFANSSYKIRKNDKMLDLNNQIKSKENELSLIEKKVRLEITKVISVYHKDLTLAQEEIAKFDIALMKALFAIRYDCVIPKIIENKQIKIKSSRNLPIANELAKKKLEYQTIDIELTNKMNVLTGANMGGKTTILKTVGQFIYLASKAIPLPCEQAELGLFDFIYFSGVQANRMDLSSFGAEVVGINNALNKAGVGLFLLDEFARGTNPQEGEAFSSAILTVFEEKEAICFAATHFSLPAGLQSADHFRVVGINRKNVQKLEAELDLQTRLQELHKYMDYSLEQVKAGAEPPRSALLIAELLGVEEKIINCAKQKMEENKTK